MLFQPHPDPNLRRHWYVTQIGLVLLPFSTLLGGVTLLINSFVLWAKYANQLVQNLVNQVLLMLGVWMIIIALFAQYKGYSLPGLFNFLPFFIVFVAQSRLIESPQQLRRMAWLMVLPSIAIAVIGLGQLFWGWEFHLKLLTVENPNGADSDGIILDWLVHRGGRPEGRMSSLFYYATVLASYFVTTFTLSLGLWIEAIFTRRSRGWQRWLSILGLGAIVALDGVALFLTNSRNAWGIALAACVLYAVYVGWRWVLGVVAWVVVAVLEAAYGPPPLRDWFRAIVPRIIWARINDELFLDRPIASLRATQWKFAWSMIQQRPLTGWGLRNFTPMYEAAMNYYIGHPHNLPLMLAAEMGIPATLIFYSLIGWVMFKGVMWLRESGRSWDDHYAMFSIVLTFAACSVFSLFDVPIFDARINLMGWLLLAGIWGVVLRKE
ncbi:MAG: hypothetical protein B0A82_06630 [Alkalinema sp. CACIAM 70d]|nr:MAG: hypothetical protein B0A82_06630 [Alkalinema sp. CACIAM 70d]